MTHFFSFIVIRFFLQSSFNHDQPQLQTQLQLQCNWFNQKAKQLIVERNYSNSPFCNNVNTLIREAHADSAQVMVIPFSLNMKDPAAFDRPKYVEMVKLYNDKLKEIASNTNAVWCNYVYEDIKAESWMDDCHLDAAGESQKGKMVGSKIIEYITSVELQQSSKN
jgi:hypothetical protein